MTVPKELKINFDLKIFLKDERINEVQYKLDVKAYKSIFKFLKRMAKLGYEFDVIVDDKKYYLRNGEILNE